MNYQTLQIFLPAFMAVFFGTLTMWTYFRNIRSGRADVSHDKRIFPELKLTIVFFKVLLGMSIVLALVYAYFPEYYYMAGPIAWLDTPVLNTIGVLLLKYSLVWLVMAQFNIERTVSLFNSGIEVNVNRLFNQSQKLILTGILLMFFGLFVTISSVVAILILLCGLALFERVQRLC